MSVNNDFSYIQDLAITLCRSNPAHKLINYRNLCEASKKEIDSVIYPFRQKILRGHYLSSKLNKQLNKKIDTLASRNSDNTDLIKQSTLVKDNLKKNMEYLKTLIDNKYNINIDIENYGDTLNSYAKNDMNVYDFINIGILYADIKEQLAMPVALSQSNNIEMGNLNIRTANNTGVLRNTSNELSDSIALSERYEFILKVVSEAINISSLFRISNNEEFLKTHNNTEIKEWLSNVSNYQGNSNL